MDNSDVELLEMVKKVNYKEPLLPEIKGAVSPKLQDASQTKKNPYTLRKINTLDHDGVSGILSKRH